jgi:oligosaccharide reducing-end xylanase
MAGRGCSGQIVNSNPPDFMNISSFVLGNQGTLAISAINNLADNAYNQSGWCVYLIHELDNGSGYSPLPSATLQQSVNYMSANQSKFWVDSFGDVVRYIRERNASTATELFNTGTSITVQVADNLNNSIYNFPITIRRPLSSGWSSASASQGGNDLGAQIVTVNGTNYVMFDAVPNAGNVTILKK